MKGAMSKNENSNEINNQLDELIKTVKAQHAAIDILFARLILLDKGFMPSKFGKPWKALQLGNAAILRYDKKKHERC